MGTEHVLPVMGTWRRRIAAPLAQGVLDGTVFLVPERTQQHPKWHRWKALEDLYRLSGSRTAACCGQTDIHIKRHFFNKTHFSNEQLEAVTSISFLLLMVGSGVSTQPVFLFRSLKP